MVPTASADGLLSSLTRNGSPVTYTTQTIKGLEYAFFTAAAGTYAARYGTAATAGPAITAVSAATTEAGTPALTWDTSQPATTEISWSKGTDALDQKIVIAESARKHRLELPQLEAGATYRYRVRSRNQFGRDTAYPAPDRPPATFTVPARLTEPPGIAGVRAVALPDGTASVSGHESQGERQRPVRQHGDRPGPRARRPRPGHRSRGRSGPAPAGAALLLPRDVPHAVGELRELADRGARHAGLRRRRQPPGAMADGNASGTVVARRGDGELRLAASQGSGTYLSRLLDIQQMVDWRRAVLDADVPAGTSLTIQARTGSTSAPDNSWSPWTDVGGGGPSRTA